MAWRDREIDRDQVSGFGGALFASVLSGTFDENAVTDERLDTARSLVEDKLLDPKVGNLVDVAVGYASQQAFMDVLDGEAKLSESLDRMLVYAFISNYAFDQRNSNTDTFSETARKFEQRLESSARSFSVMARDTLSKGRAPDDEGIESSTHSTKQSW